METDSGTLATTGRRVQQLSAARYVADFRARLGWRLYLLVFAVPLEWLSASLHFHSLLVNYAIGLAACLSAALPSDLMLFGLFILAWILHMSPTVTAALGLVSILCRLLLTSSALGLLMGRVPAISSYSAERVRKQWHAGSAR